MREEQPNARPDITVVPGDQQKSVYWSDVEARALQQGMCPKDILARDKLAAKSMALVSDDCLIPDEAEGLAEKVRIHNDAVEILSTALLTIDEKAAIVHMSSCAFCRSMVALMEPVAANREKFLSVVRGGAKEGNRPIMRPSFRQAYIPPMILVSLWCMVGASLFVIPTLTAATLIYYSPVLVAGAVIAFLVGYFSRRAGSRKHLSFLLDSRANQSGGIFLTAVPAAVALILTGFAGLTLRSEVKDSQLVAVNSISYAILKSSRPAQAMSSVGPLIDADAVRRSAGANFQLVSEHTLLLKQNDVPGGISASIDENMVKVSWDILGRSIETFDIRVVGPESASLTSDDALKRLSAADRAKVLSTPLSVVVEDIRHRSSFVLATSKQ